jgi:sugar phosphate isomerase/epimerase
MKLGVYLDHLGLSARAALAWASKHGVAGVQFDAVGELGPEQLSATGRRELKNLLRSHSLTLTAVGAPLRRGLDVAENQQPRIDHLRKVLALSAELGTGLVVVQAGEIPEKPDDPRRALLTEALLALGHEGDRRGAVLAVETGLNSGTELRDFLTPLASGGLGVNFDPANLLMNGFDPVANVLPLGKLIVHAHAKDARIARANRAATEVPVGAGDIEWMALLAAMEALEYRGWLVAERESGDDRATDLANGLAFLRRFVR